MLYQKIKELCTKKRISIRELERQSGLSNGTINKWNRASPSIDNLQSVANVLKVSIKDLLK